MYRWIYLYRNYFPFSLNTRRTSSKIFSPLDLTAGGFRNKEGGQDSNIDENDDDMSRLQETEATYEDRGDEEYDRTRSDMERDWYQEDFERYHEEERDYQDFQWPEKYGWDQYA